MRHSPNWIVLVLAVALVHGCAGPPQVESGDPLAAMPEDFMLALSVVRGERSTPDKAHEQVASRWVLFPDGSLCYEHTTGAKSETQTLPPLTRVLSRAQMATVWSHARQLGLLAHDAGEPALNAKLIEAGTDEVVYHADVRANDRYRTILQRTPIDADPPGVAQLVQNLGELSWAEEGPSMERPLAPKRYNFGPDPYARYRQ